MSSFFTKRLQPEGKIIKTISEGILKDYQMFNPLRTKHMGMGQICPFPPYINLNSVLRGLTHIM